MALVPISPGLGSVGGHLAEDLLGFLGRVRRSCASATSLAGPVAAAIAKVGHDRGGQAVTTGRQRRT
jgi:hypothetical protein